jgi:hypothetical protein
LSPVTIKRAERGSAGTVGGYGLRMFLRWCCLLAFAGWLASAVHAALQFDVFLGYDGVVREANWYPVVCEVLNDGPTFDGIIELSSGQFGTAQTRRLYAELPTNTRKRFVIPVFGAGLSSSWNARLTDARGKVRAEWNGLQPKRAALSKNFLLGAVPRSFTGLPVLPETRVNRPEAQPAVCHLRPELFPDNPIALQGLDAIYLNSEKAPDLKVGQVNALLAWVQAGGQLIVAVEQPGDVNATPWLHNLLPCDLTGVTTKPMQGEMLAWLQNSRRESAENETVTPAPSPPRSANQGNAGMSAAMRKRYNLQTQPAFGEPTSAVSDPFANLAGDADFDRATLALSTSTVSTNDGRVVLAVSNTPLIIEAARGRGLVTVLTFSPEREPVRAWKNRPWFWAKIAHLPTELVVSADYTGFSGSSIDGVFGAMIDSKQVRKLPVSWLLLLLVAYLAVIGPVDQYCLKRLNKQMLTWITFPCYVALFSGLIYFIGYKLRAGETECNELHVVDVLPRGDGAELHGHTYVSVYSPANANFRFASEQPYATLRGESQGAYGGAQENNRANVEQRGNGFRAEIFVPVWTSQLFESDWWQPAEVPLSAVLVPQLSGYSVTVRNHLNRPLTELRLVLNDRIHFLGNLEPQQQKDFKVNKGQGGTWLREFIAQNSDQFQNAIQERRQAFGRDPSSRVWNLALSSMAASFLSQIDQPARVFSQGFYRSAFIASKGLDLTPLLARGQAILFAWDAGDSLVRPIEQFSPRRNQRDTLLRLSIPVAAPGPE